MSDIVEYMENAMYGNIAATPDMAIREGIREIQRLRDELEKYRKICVKLTNSDPVVNEHNEIIGYTATHEILDELELINKE